MAADMNKTIALILTLFAVSVLAFNGDDFELECPDDCDCHYFRINWVTDCSESNLTSIPYDELSLSVYILDLNGNNISHIDPFPKDLKMRRLQLANNILQSVERSSFAGLEYLIDVDLSGNNISKVDPEAFMDSRGLLNVELQGNPLKHEGGPFLISTTLQFLDISSCQLTSLDQQFFENITSLTSLDLSKNPLKSLDSGTFDDLTVLDTLKLDDCQLSYIASDTFINLVGLKHLELSGNMLTDTVWSEVLGNLVRLEYLNLRNSKISQLGEYSFANTTNLETLILAENVLPNLKVAMTLGSGLQYLSTLDLSNCHVRGPLSEDAFVNATKLKVLYLSGNPLYALDLQAALEPLPKLEKLFLSGCGLKNLPDNFNLFTELQELDISHNPLSDVFTKLISPLEKLEYLNMGYSNLSYIAPDTFSKMTSMKRLVLSGNDLNSLEAGLFGNLTQLASLELEYCGLRRSLNANVFFKNLTYTDLKEVKLAGNPLVGTANGPLLPRQLSRVTDLDLRKCNLSALHEDAFKMTENITDLNLAGNKLAADTNSYKFLNVLGKLEVLDMSSNNLTTINPQVFKNNPKIRSLKLIGNPFKCDCNIAEMWDWAAMIKGDLDVLVGAKSVAQDITVKGNKKKKNLLCHYSEEQLKLMPPTNRSVPGRRPFVKPRELTATNRTWAKYVRESGCEPLVKILKPVAFRAAAFTMPEQSHVPVVPEIPIMAIVTIVICSIGMLFLSIRLRRKNRRAEELAKSLG